MTFIYTESTKCSGKLIVWFFIINLEIMNKGKEMLKPIFLVTILLWAIGCVQAQNENQSKTEVTMTTNKNTAGNEAQIRQQLDNFVKAFRTKDLNLMMSVFSAKMVAFDIIPPLEYVGSDIYRKVWEEVFAFFQDSIDVEMRNLTVIADNNVAFSYCLFRLNATVAKNGQKIDFWERLTCCFQKIDDKWLIVHEHVSLPADLTNGKALMDLKPAN